MPNTPSIGRPDVGTSRIAVHKVIQVTLLWQQEVKASIDRDVKLGVLEAAPVGRQVTWCHRMVAARKKNGKPRRTEACRCSTNMLSVKHTTHTSRFSRHCWCLQGPRRRSPMLGIGISVCQSEKKPPKHYVHYPMGLVPIRTWSTGYAVSQDEYIRRFHEIVTVIPNKT